MASLMIVTTQKFSCKVNVSNVSMSVLVLFTETTFTF